MTHTAQTQGNPMVPRTTLAADAPPGAVTGTASPQSAPATVSSEQTSMAASSSEQTPAQVSTPLSDGSQSVAVPPGARAFGRQEEPVAEVLVNAMVNSLTDRRAGSDGITRIGISQMRNQSRVTQREYEEFNARLADILTQAAHDPKVVFLAGDTDPATLQYQMQGSAYLTTFEGFDLWELFISISPADRNMTLWSANGPVYVMRQPRPGQPQMVVKVTK